MCLPLKFIRWPMSENHVWVLLCINSAEKSDQKKYQRGATTKNNVFMRIHFVVQLELYLRELRTYYRELLELEKKFVQPTSNFIKLLADFPE